MKKILFILSVCFLPQMLIAEDVITRPYPIISEQDGSPSLRKPRIVVPNDSLIDGTSQAWLMFSGSTNNPVVAYIQNIGTGTNQIFNVSSGTVGNLHVSTLTIDGSLVIPSTLTVDTINARHIKVSTITGASPLRIQGLNVLNFSDNTEQYTAAVSIATTSVILNTSTYENKQFNISSGTVFNFNVSTITFSDNTVQTTAFTLLTLWDTDIDGNLMPSNSILASDSYWEINIDNDLIPKP